MTPTIRWLLLVLVAASLSEVALASNVPSMLTDDTQGRCKMIESSDLSSIPDAPTQITAVNPVKSTAKTESYCQISGYVSPSIGIKLTLPSHWNGKLVEVGCGGHCGEVNDQPAPWTCEGMLRKGYACVASDMGHQGGAGDALWAYHDMAAKVDWGFRATHVVALAAKAIAERYYAQKPTKSYFVGCSTGGRQALQEAQRFPWDFDGIVAGAPPVNLSTIYMTFAWSVKAAHDSAGKPLLGTKGLKLLTAAAVAKCDLDDGVKDGIIGDPLHCDFDPSELACKRGQTENCLDARQIEAARKIYAGPMTSTGMKLSPGGPLPGSEYFEMLGYPHDWSTSYIGRDGQPAFYGQLATEGFRYLFFLPEPGPTWKLSDFDFDRDYTRLPLMETIYDSSNPDLRKFKAAGGKMIAYQGMNDNSVLPRSTIDYYEAVTRTMGGPAETRDFFRLFLLPGVLHCTGGSGAFAVDYLSYLEAWVENGRAPDELLSSHISFDDMSGTKFDAAEYERRLDFPLDPGKVTFSRPVYPYPVTTKYAGHGDPREALSFRPSQPRPQESAQLVGDRPFSR
jgi:hypothetical protein